MELNRNARRRKESPMGFVLRVLIPFCVLLLPLVSLAFTLKLEFGALSHRVLHVDEAYFAACAARGLATGQLPIAGCHDNKAPLIYLVYEALFLVVAPYSIFAIKVAGFFLVGLIALLSSALAIRLAGFAAGVVSFALVVEVFASDAGFSALKTEPLGMLFALGALLVITAKRSRQQRWTLFSAGILAGAAVLSKQTYAVVPLAVVIWLWFVEGGKTPLRVVNFLTATSCFCAGAGVPFAAFLSVFTLQGRAFEFLGSLLLYPAVYGGSDSFGAASHIVWKLGALLDNLARFEVATVMCTGAVVMQISSGVRSENTRNEKGEGRTLVLLVCGLLSLMLLASPIYFPYHTIPLWVMMGILGSLVAGDNWPKLCSKQSVAALAVAAGFVATLVLSLIGTWHTNAGRGDMEQYRVERSVLPTITGQYAYVLGAWPAFYFYNRLIPASDVQFAWALPGTPATWHFKPPDPASERGRMLARVRERSLVSLFEDFKRTPPRYILVLAEMSGEKGSLRVSDVPGFDEFLSKHCVFSREITDVKERTGRLFECRDGAAVLGGG